MNSLFSESDNPDPAASALPAPPEASASAEGEPADDSKLSRAERRRRREENARALTGPMTESLARRGRGDRDLMDGTQDYRLVPIGDVQEDDDNPRTVYREIAELAKSIRENGLQQPIKCWVDRKGVLHLKDGHRRLRASKLAALTHIGTLIEYSEGQKLRQQVSANIHHEKMNPVDEAFALKRMMREEKIATEQQLAESLGKSLGWVNMRMQLTRMSKDEQQAIRDGRLAYTEAIKRRNQGRDILTGEWINAEGIGGFAGGELPHGKPSQAPLGKVGARRFARDLESRQAGAASIQRQRPALSEQEAAEDEAPDASEHTRKVGHFSDEHALAFRVSHRCGNHGRPTPQLGGVGCGECWEYIIRMDERIQVKVENAPKKR